MCFTIAKSSLTGCSNSTFKYAGRISDVPPVGECPGEVSSMGEILNSAELSNGELRVCACECVCVCVYM